MLPQGGSCHYLYCCTEQYFEHKAAFLIRLLVRKFGVSRSCAHHFCEIEAFSPLVCWWVRRRCTQYVSVQLGSAPVPYKAVTYTAGLCQSVGVTEVYGSWCSKMVESLFGYYNLRPPTSRVGVGITMRKLGKGETGTCKVSLPQGRHDLIPIELSPDLDEDRQHAFFNAIQ